MCGIVKTVKTLKRQNGERKEAVMREMDYQIWDIWGISNL
jgi:hypothetical protein